MNRKYTDDNLKGKKFGSLTYVSFSHTGKKSASFCKWKCDCGKEIIARAYEVVRGRKKSCDCYFYRRKENSSLWNGYGEIPGRYWGSIISRTKTKNIKITITINDAWDLFIKQNKKCALTDELLSFESRSKKADGTASLDRIDSTKGYEIGNVQWIHKDVNFMKQELPEGEFFLWCRKIVSKLDNFIKSGKLLS